MGLTAAELIAQKDLVAAVSYTKRMTATLKSSDEHWAAFSVPVCSLSFGITREVIGKCYERSM